jgi:hypothetical protein
MSAPLFNLEIDQGATFRKGFVFKNHLKKPYDWTGYGAHMQIRDKAGNLIADLSSQNGKIIMNAVPGGVDIYINALETAAMTFTDKAYYDLYLIAPNGDYIRKLQGAVTLSKGQTRNA